MTGPHEPRRIARLQALGVLDTPADAAFDAIARLAQGFSGTPIALVTLVDAHRQWFRANVGLDGLAETPREIAFCAHAIAPPAGGGPMVPLAVPDAAQDERFAANPLVTGEPGIRFYLGAPIVLSDGLAMGTVCVIDRSPRAVRPGEAAQLQDLARLAADLLEARERSQLLAREQRRLDRLMTDTRATRWDIDLGADALPAPGGRSLSVPPGSHLAEWMAQIHPLDRPRAADALWRHVVGQRPLYEAELRRLDAQDRWRWMQDRGRVTARDADGAPRWLEGFTLDAHERLSARHALERERRLLSAGPCVLLRCSAVQGWRLMEASANVQALLGRRSDELLGGPGTTLLSLVHPDDRAQLPAHGSLSPRHGLRLRLRHAAGDWRVVDATFVDEPPEPGCERPVRAYLVDATERAQMEAALRQREQQMQAVVDSAMDAIIAVDEHARVVLFNPAATRIFGLGRDEALGQPLSRFVPERLRERHDRHFEGFRREGTSAREMGARSRLLGVDADGREFPIEVTIARTEDTGQPMYTAIVRDVTERLAAEDAQRALAEAEAASQAKTAFLSRVSHELRTPLNGILGFGRLMLTDPAEPLSPAQAERAGHIQRSGQHLLSLIDDLLDLSRLQLGALPLALGPVNLCELVRWALDALGPAAGEAGVRLHANPALRGCCVRADPRALRQIVLNLLSNAVKYNRPGGRVDIEAKASPGHWHLAVADTGAGMEPRQLEHLFEPFNRLGAEAGPTPGTGLGLVISRELALRMDGELQAESTPGVGSRFVLTLPALACPDEAGAAGLPADAGAVADTGAPPALPPLRPVPLGEGRLARAIYIEDEPVNVLVMEQVFRRAGGWSLRVFGEAESGLAAALAEPPELLLTDMNLPGLQGDEVLRRMKADARMAATRVVVVSGDALAAQRQRAVALGADGYWTKPIDVDEVLRQLAALRSAAGAGRDAG